MLTNSEEKIIQIKNRIHKKVKFYSSFGIYLIICTFLTFLDYFDSSKYNNYSIDWVYWVWLGWGVAILYEYLNAFILPNVVDKLIQKEIDKLD